MVKIEFQCEKCETEIGVLGHDWETDDFYIECWICKHREHFSGMVGKWDD
jgi:DNA-directed RNA polymerase subunit RPC12/RpoP